MKVWERMRFLGGSVKFRKLKQILCIYQVVQSEYKIFCGVGKFKPTETTNWAVHITRQIKIYLSLRSEKTSWTLGENRVSIQESRHEWSWADMWVGYYGNMKYLLWICCKLFFGRQLEIPICLKKSWMSKSFAVFFSLQDSCSFYWDAVTKEHVLQHHIG